MLLATIIHKTCARFPNGKEKNEAKIKIGENKSKPILYISFLSNAPEINAALKKVNVKT